MKTKFMAFLKGVMVLTVVLLTGYRPVAAAPPMGEAKTVAQFIGNGIPIPYLEGSQANDYMQLLYDYLVGSTPEGKFTPDLGLAEKWEMSPDALTWTFYLRKGVKFHNGAELTAKDVKFSIEQQTLPDSISEQSGLIRREIENIEVKDPYTLVIRCKRPYLWLLSLFNNTESTDGMVIPKDYYERVGKEEFAKHPIGSGPYKWHSGTVGSFIKLEATDKHWRDGVPRYKYMTYLIIPEESTRLAMLKTGEADIARIGRQSVKEALSAGLNVLTKGNGRVVVFVPNMQWASPVFSDIRFRKALNLAIDKDAIIKQLFDGMAMPLATWPGSNISAVGGNPTLKTYPYNPQEARRLVKEGGWEGYEFTLISYPRAGCPEFSLVVEALAGYWEKIGLKPKIKMTEWAVWRQAWKERKTQNTINGYDDSTNPVAATLLVKLEEKWYSGSAFSSVNIPELNQKYERIQKSMNINEISNLMADIYRHAYDNYLMIPICEFPEKVATVKSIPKWDLGLRRNDRNYYDLIKQR
jgi:peptide/nickel transport system substrate-binding protein